MPPVVSLLHPIWYWIPELSVIVLPLSAGQDTTPEGLDPLDVAVLAAVVDAAEFEEVVLDDEEVDDPVEELDGRLDVELGLVDEEDDEVDAVEAVVVVVTPPATGS